MMCCMWTSTQSSNLEALSPLKDCFTSDIASCRACNSKAFLKRQKLSNTFSKVSLTGYNLVSDFHFVKKQHHKHCDYFVAESTQGEFVTQILTFEISFYLSPSASCLTWSIRAVNDEIRAKIFGLSTYSLKS